MSNIPLHIPHTCDPVIFTNYMYKYVPTCTQYTVVVERRKKETCWKVGMRQNYIYIYIKRYKCGGEGEHFGTTSASL
jgi:hypothetical protein